jgi:hypothetical protein
VSKLVSVAVAIALSALAQEALSATPARLFYAHPAFSNCPDRAEIVQKVEDRVGAGSIADDAPMTISATIARSGHGLEARVELQTRTASAARKRTLRSARSDCRELAAAVVLAISIAIDPLSGLGGVSQPQAHTATTAPRKVRPERPEAIVVPLAEHAVTRIGAGLAVSVGSAPDLAFGAVLSAGVRKAWASIAVEARGDLPSSKPIGTGRISTSLYAASLLPCVEGGPWAGCVVLRGGVLQGAAHDLPDARSVTSPYAAVGARGMLDVLQSSDIAMRLSVEIAAPWVRTTLTAGGVDLWRTPPLSAAFGLTMVWNSS